MRALAISILCAGAPAIADPAATATAGGEPAPWTLGIEPRIGAIVSTSKLGAMVVGGVELDAQLPVQERQVGVALDVGLTRPSYSATAMSPQIAGSTTDYTIHQTELAVAALVTYRLFRDGRALVPRFGVGPLVHMLRTNETATASPGENTAQETKLGVEALAGVDLRAGPGFASGELRFVYSGLDTPLAGSTNAGHVGLSIGYRLVF